MRIKELLARELPVEELERVLPPILDSNKVLKIKREIFWEPVRNKYYRIKEITECNCSQCLLDGYSFKRSQCKLYLIKDRHKELFTWSCLGEVWFEEIPMRAKEKRAFKKTKNYYTITGRVTKY